MQAMLKKQSTLFEFLGQLRLTLKTANGQATKISSQLVWQKRHYKTSPIQLSS